MSAIQVRRGYYKSHDIFLVLLTVVVVVPSSSASVFHCSLIILMANLVKVEFLEEHENPFEMVTPAEDISQEGQLLYLLWVKDGDNIAYGRVFVADYNNELLIEDYYQFICTQ